MNVRNEIKAQIIRAGMTMQEVVDLLSDEYGFIITEVPVPKVALVIPSAKQPFANNAA